MNHLSEEQLILHYYGEEGDALTCEEHLEACPGCRELYGSLQRVLNVVDSLPVPERGPEYGAEVWRRIQQRVPSRRRWLPAFEWRWAAASVAMAGLLIAAFIAGRYYPGIYPQTAKNAPTQLTAAADPQAGERVLLVAVGDYLERSQMVLIELANADTDSKAKLDISAEQERAASLVSESRLYRQTAEHTGDTAVAGVLDDLDRVLLNIANGPSEVSPAELEDLRQKLKAEGILFKIRVLGSNVRTQEKEKPNATGGRHTL